VEPQDFGGPIRPFDLPARSFAHGCDVLINRKKEDGRLISYFGFTPPKVLRIFAEYRRLYPNGKLHIYALTVFTIAMIALIVVGVLYLTR